MNPNYQYVPTTDAHGYPVPPRPAVLPAPAHPHWASSPPVRYELEVVQQPSRARMCGFGEKDRRQLTPPPSIRLHMYNAHTGQEYTDISAVDKSFFVLMVELWSEDGMVNRTMVDMAGVAGDGASGADGAGADPGRFYERHPGYLQMGQQQQYQQQQHQHRSHRPHQHSPHQHHHNSPQGGSSAAPPPPGQGESGLIRNLIGTLAAPAYKLTDLSNMLGLWFVLHDLSVRTEGVFRLKFSFMDLADAMPGSGGGGGNGGNGGNGRPAPVLAQAFSAPFQSFSAKNFPGVVASTPLSMCFAAQGVKIPIRSEKRRRRPAAGEPSSSGSGMR